MFKYFLSALIIFLVSAQSLLHADSVKLKTGVVLEGQFVELSDKDLVIQTVYGKRVRVNFDKIDDANLNEITRLPKIEQKEIANSPSAKAAVGWLWYFALILTFFVFFIILSIFTQIIAVKMGIEYSWMAWIPIANYFLLCKMAAVRYEILFLLLLFWIPIVGVLVQMGVSIYLWYNIAVQLKKPTWVGVISGIFPFNLVTLGYLAFSKK